MCIYVQFKTFGVFSENECYFHLAGHFFATLFGLQEKLFLVLELKLDMRRRMDPINFLNYVQKQKKKHKNTNESCYFLWSDRMKKIIRNQGGINALIMLSTILWDTKFWRKKNHKYIRHIIRLQYISFFNQNILYVCMDCSRVF